MPGNLVWRYVVLPCAGLETGDPGEGDIFHFEQVLFPFCLPVLKLSVKKIISAQVAHVQETIRNLA